MRLLINWERLDAGVFTSMLPAIKRRSRTCATRATDVAKRRQSHVNAGTVPESENAGTLVDLWPALATEASVNVPRNRPIHLYYDNAAYAGSDISSACHPSLNEGVVTSNHTFIAGKDQEVTPKLDRLIQSSMISVLLPSTPPADGL